MANFGKKSAAEESDGPVSPAANKTGGAKPRFTLKPSRQTCFALGGLTVLTLFGCGGLYVWQSGEIGELEKQVRDKQTQLASSEKIVHRLAEVETENTKTRGQLRFLETSVTAGEYVPTLLKQTEGLAKSVNLNVASLRPTLEPAPKPPADKEAAKKFKSWPYDKLHVDMEVSGNYWSVAKMLYKLTEFPKIMAVESLQVTPAATTANAAPSLNVKIKLTGFIFPNDGVPREATPPSAATKLTPAASVAAPTAPAAGVRAAAPVTPGVTPVKPGFTTVTQSVTAVKA